MELSLTDEQGSVRDAFAQLFDRASTPADVRGAEEAGVDPGLWAHVVGMGAPTLAVAEALGGGGGTLLDLSIVTHEQGRRLGSVPLVESAVAARLLERLDAREPLAELVAGGERWTLALRPTSDGIATLVPAGAVADRVLAMHGDDLVLVGSGASQDARVAVLGSIPVASWSVGEAPDLRVLGTGPAAWQAWTTAVAEWKVLTAALLVGAGFGALDLAVEYVCERRQFGVAIGSFQTVAHRLADAAVDLEGARLLAREAAWASDRAPEEIEVLAPMAFACAASAAQRAARDGLHFHGGYGFMLEYDIQLYFRRVKAWALVLGDPAREYARVGELLRSGAAI